MKKERKLISKLHCASCSQCPTLLEEGNDFLIVGKVEDLSEHAGDGEVGIRVPKELFKELLKNS